MSFLTSPKAQTLASKPRRRVSFGQFDRTAGYPVTCDISGTPAAVAELERYLMAREAIVEALIEARPWVEGAHGVWPDGDVALKDLARIDAALALLDAPEAPPVAAHAAVGSEADDYPY